MKTSMLDSKLVVAALLALALFNACGSGQPGSESAGNQDTTASNKENEANHANDPKEPAGTSYPGSTDSTSSSASTPPAQK